MAKHEGGQETEEGDSLTPSEFAQKHFRQYKIKGNEIVPTYCPFCHGGQRSDKETFALNLDKGTYNCKRGKCGVAGSFYQLCKEFGETPTQQNMEVFHRKQRNYVLPKTKVKPTSSPVEEYLTLRGFSKETWERFGIGDSDGNIAIPFTENGKVVMVKFRHPRKTKKGEQKEWKEKGGKPIFWGMDHCTPDKPLTITEGIMDALSLYEAGIENVASVPNGTNDLTCIDLCWDWLERFNRVILWADNDPPGRELQQKLINRLGVWRCWTVQSERKDVNEVLYFDGAEKVRELHASAKEVPINGLIRLADVKPFDWSTAERVSSGIRGLDEILGGFMMGQLSVWTGKRSHGKSTILGQVLLDAIEQGYAVCAYSGELIASVYQFWIDLQAAGPDHVGFTHDPIKRATVPTIPRDVQTAIHRWYYDKFFLHSKFGLAEETKILEIFDYAAKRYGCKMFLIDNLMTTVVDEGQDSNYYRAQAKFVQRLADFAHIHNAHMHLVSHPRKTRENLDMNDVSGAGEITNRADNVFVMQRLDEEEVLREQCDSLLIVKKNRVHGIQDVEIQLNFEPKSKRFYMPSENPNKQYGWVLGDEEDEGRDVPWE